jgi:hypothetical protein
MTGALAIVGEPAFADPGVSTNASGYVDNGRPTAAASYRQTTVPVEAVEDDVPAAQPVADSGDAPVPAPATSRLCSSSWRMTRVAASISAAGWDRGDGLVALRIPMG